MGVTKKEINHRSDAVCIWVFKRRGDRNNLIDENLGIIKADRENYYNMHYT
mgnify:CR=1 FL=1